MTSTSDHDAVFAIVLLVCSTLLSGLVGLCSSAGRWDDGQVAFVAGGFAPVAGAFTAVLTFVVAGVLTGENVAETLPFVLALSIPLGALPGIVYSVPLGLAVLGARRAMRLPPGTRGAAARLLAGTSVVALVTTWVALGHDEPHPLLEHEPPEPAIAGTALELPVRVSRDPSHRVARVVVRYRRGTERALREASAVAGQSVRISAVSLPTDRAPYQIHYFLEGRASDGTPVTTLGSASEPFTIDVRAPGEATARASRDGRSIFRTWWFWTITGAVVAGAAVTTAIVVTSGGSPDSDRGTVDLR